MQLTLTIRIPREVRRELQAISKAEHIAVSDLVREAIRKTIAIHQFRRLRKRVVPYARSQGFLSDEDVFDAVS